MEAVQLSTRPLGECGFQLSSIGACSFGHKGTISGLRPLNQIDKECKLYLKFEQYAHNATLKYNEACDAKRSNYPTLNQQTALVSTSQSVHIRPHNFKQHHLRHVGKATKATLASQTEYHLRMSNVWAL